MRIFKRQISNWWLVPVALLAIASIPLLLMLFFVGNNFVGAIIGPPFVLNITQHQPSNDVLAGTYKEVSRNLRSAYDNSNSVPQGSASILLEADGTGAVVNLPFEDDDFKLCVLSGIVSWNAEKDTAVGVKINFTVISDRPVYQGARACKSSNSGSFSFAELTGQSNPYGIYWDVGDPDSGTGLEFLQQK